MNCIHDFIPYNRQPINQVPGTQMPAPGGGYGAPSPLVPTTSAFAGQTVAPTSVVATGTTLGGAQIAPQTLQSTLFTPGYLRTQIGRRVRVEFLIGTNTTTDRIGTLLGVGASYILIQPAESDDIMMCDLYSIKFVTFYY